MGRVPKSFTVAGEWEEGLVAGMDQLVDLRVRWLSHVSIPGI